MCLASIYTILKSHLKLNIGQVMSEDFTTHENHSCYSDYRPLQILSFLGLAA